jgi:hypothetical protein
MIIFMNTLLYSPSESQSIAITHNQSIAEDLLDSHSRPSQSQIKVTLRLTVSQSVSLGIEPHLGPMTRYLFLSDSYVLVSVGRPL